MSYKTFTYVATTKTVYLEGTDEYEDFGEEFEYDVSYDDIKEALSELIYADYFSEFEESKFEFNKSLFLSRTTSGLKRFIEDYCDIDDLIDEYYDGLKDYFERDALDSYYNRKEEDL